MAAASARRRIERLARHLEIATMPPRGFVVAVVAFWLAMTCVLVQRDLLPRWRTDDAPPFAIEFTDEAGSPQVEWLVFRKGEQIGRGLTQVRRQPDRTFELSQRFRFDRFDVQVLVAKFALKRLDTTYRVTRDGQLLSFNVNAVASIADWNAAPIEFTGEIDGVVKDGLLNVNLTAMNQPLKVAGLGKIPVAENGSFLNPMHLVHRVPGLEVGRRWRVPLFDPTEAFASIEIFGHKLPPVPGLADRPSFLEAEVFADTLTWNREPVECLRISYRTPGKDETARTWVRRSDGIVLGQDARQLGSELSIRRTP
jgi:hypothetical protein